MMTLYSAYSRLEDIDSVHQQQKTVCSCITDGKRVFCRQGYVPADSVALFRKQLGCDTFRTEEKGTGCVCPMQKSDSFTEGKGTFAILCFADPEEFINLLFQKVFSVEPLLKLRYYCLRFD